MAHQAQQHDACESFARSHARTRAALATVLAWLGLACTSIAPVSKSSQPEAQAEAGSTSRVISDQAQAPDAAAMVATESESCDQTGAVRCAQRDGVQRLICKEAYWEKHDPCAADQRCDATADSPVTQCKALASECLGRQAGTPFCGGTELRVCTSELTSTRVECPQNERCVTRNHLGSCDCLLGAERNAAGDCQLGTGCPDGACDAKTTCSVVNGERSCSMCPAGYSGDGLTGCAPLLLELTPSCGTLEAAVTADEFDYTIVAPLTCQTVRLTVRVPTGAAAEINGRELDSEMQWTSAPLAFGDNTVNLTVTEADFNNAYRVTIRHTGEQTQTVRASRARAKDFFGTSLAIDADTLVVGAPFEDGGSASDSSDPVDAGAAYVFVREGERWVEQARLKPDQPIESEFFGAAVAVRGDTIVVGATGSDPSDWPSDRERDGAVYVFQRSGATWSQVDRFTPSSPTGGDFFGNKLALDDDTLLVAAPYDSSVGMESGAIYVFDRAGGGFS
ncbi:MAG TPA: cadherin-like beta sandwich domain-containing protein, partial [Polyangiales bacterium]|nr:cadherin-like beta sandwich domain-containing protein [Polyangiales bacterium]